MIPWTSLRKVVSAFADHVSIKITTSMIHVIFTTVLSTAIYFSALSTDMPPTTFRSGSSPSKSGSCFGPMPDLSATQTPNVSCLCDKVTPETPGLVIIDSHHSTALSSSSPYTHHNTISLSIKIPLASVLPPNQPLKNKPNQKGKLTILRRRLQQSHTIQMEPLPRTPIHVTSHHLPIANLITVTIPRL